MPSDGETGTDAAPGASRDTGTSAKGTSLPAGNGRGRGHGRGRHNRRHHHTITKQETITQPGGIAGAPYFKTPTENGDKALFNKVKGKVRDYVLDRYDHGLDIGSLLSNLTDPVITEPFDHTQAEIDKMGVLKRMKWENECQIYFERVSTLKSNKVILYSILWNQFSSAMRIKVKGTSGYTENKEGNNCVWLLETIRAVCLDYDSSKSELMSLDNSLERLILYRQLEKTNEDYFRGYMTLVAVFEQQGGDLLYGQKFRDKVTKKIPVLRGQSTEEHEAQIKQELRIQREKIITVSLIK